MNKILLATMLFFAMALQHDGRAADSCLSVDELKVQIASRLDRSKALSANLEKFVDGRTKIDMPVSALFTIDFNDADSVERRIQDLIKKTAQDPLKVEPFQSWLGCKSGQELSAEIKELAENDQKNDLMRLKFFKTEIEARNNLISIQTESTKQNQALMDVGATQVLAEKTKADAEKNQAKAEAQSQEAEDFNSKEIAAAYAIVEKYRQELADYSLNVTKAIELRLNDYKKMTDDLVGLAAVNALNADELFQAYRRASKDWRNLTKAIFAISANSQSLDLPSPPTRTMTAKTAENNELYTDYMASLAKATDEYQKALEVHSLLSKQEKEIVAGALLKAGAIRSQLYQSTRKLNPDKIEMLSNESIDDFVTEIKVVPFRFVAYGITKLVEFRQKSSAGVKGWLDIAKQLIVFVIVISLPLLLFLFLQRLSTALDVWRRQLISRSTLDYRFRTSVALWLNRLNPYMPWVVMLIAAEASKGLLGLVGLHELGIIIPYLELYLLYRIFRRILGNVLAAVLVGGNLENLKLKNNEIQSTSRRVGLLFFFELVLLHATEDTVRRVLVYTFISSTIWYFNFLFFIFEFNKWREEILILSQKNLSKRLNTVIAKIKDKKIFIVVLPALLVMNLVYLGGLNLSRWLIRYDFFKRITSEIYKKRLQERVDATNSGKVVAQAIPDEYLGLFDTSSAPDDRVYVTRSRESYPEVLAGVNSWITNNSEVDAVVVYGDKGIGKTSMLKKVQSEVKGARAIYFDMTGKLSTRESFFKMIGDLLGAQFSSPKEFLDFDKTQPKTVLILDNAQNVFLAEQHGLDAYRGLIDLMNLQTVNIFWCLAFNRRSWDYLRGVFGHEHFYGLEFDVRSWSDIEVQKLIEERHRATGYHLSFDKVIEAVHQTDGGGGTSQLEAQFFRLLWGQSRGNPRAAILLWLSALRYLGDKKILVSIPEFSRIDELNNMSDETLFVLSAIVRHENLNLNEMINVTNIQAAKIKKAVKYCEDKKLIHMSNDERFRITPQAQYFVNSYLLGKNFLYE